MGEQAWRVPRQTEVLPPSPATILSMLARCCGTFWDLIFISFFSACCICTSYCCQGFTSRRDGSRPLLTNITSALSLMRLSADKDRKEWPGCENFADLRISKCRKHSFNVYPASYVLHWALTVWLWVPSWRGSMFSAWRGRNLKCTFLQMGSYVVGL